MSKEQKNYIDNLDILAKYEIILEFEKEINVEKNSIEANISDLSEERIVDYKSFVKKVEPLIAEIKTIIKENPLSEERDSQKEERFNEIYQTISPYFKLNSFEIAMTIFGKKNNIDFSQKNPKKKSSSSKQKHINKMK